MSDKSTRIEHRTQEGEVYHVEQTTDEQGNSRTTVGFSSSDRLFRATIDSETGGQINGIGCNKILLIVAGAIVAAGSCGFVASLLSNPSN
jgi:hypothetical protein